MHVAPANPVSNSVSSLLVRPGKEGFTNPFTFENRTSEDEND